MKEAIELNDTTQAADPGLRKKLARLLPYVITAVVITAILFEYSPRQIAAEMSRGEIVFLPLIAGLKVIVSLFMIAAADTVVVRAAGFTGARFVDVVRAKAGSSLLDILGYAAGHSAYAVWIARFGADGEKRGMEAASAMLYIMASDLFAVCTVATISLYAFDVDVPRSLSISAPVIAGVLLSFAVIGRGPLSGRIRIFGAWRVIPPALGVLQMIIRTAQISLLVVGTYLAALSFGLDIPAPIAFAYFPVILLITSLPINVAGFGAAQAAWVFFLEDYEPGARILAFQFLWSLAMVAAIFFRGLPFVRRVVKEAAE